MNPLYNQKATTSPIHISNPDLPTYVIQFWRVFVAHPVMCLRGGGEALASGIPSLGTPRGILRVHFSQYW